LCAVVVLLIGGVSGGTIAVAHLTITTNQLTEVDALMGIMYSKESNDDHSHITIMKT